MGVVHKRHVIVISGRNTVEVDVQGGVRCGDCRAPERSVTRCGQCQRGGEKRTDKMKQTVRGNKENSIDGQSTNLDIEIRDVVQKPFFPLNGVRCAVLPLPPSLGFLDVEIRWKKVKTVSIESGCHMMTICCSLVAIVQGASKRVIKREKIETGSEAKAFIVEEQRKERWW